jgi:thiamine-monophosphate kinase
VSGELGSAAQELGCQPLELALHGGEDYALAITAPPSARLEGFVVIGRCEAAASDDAAVWLARADGQLAPVLPTGFDHFAPAR